MDYAVSDPPFLWYASASELAMHLRAWRAGFCAMDADVGRCESMPGYCHVCARTSEFAVFGGAMLGEHVSLREGMVCPQCGLNGRGRLLVHAIDVSLHSPRHAEGALLECLSPLYRCLADRIPGLQGSEFIDPVMHSGELVRFRGRSVRHESVLGLSYADASLDLIAHNDVLEHVYEVDQALRECARVLRPGGLCLFNVPYFPLIGSTQVRGRLNTDGTTEHLLEPEYHGDGIHEQGIYTFYHYGPDLMERIRDAGFAQVEIGLCQAPMWGYLSANYQYGEDGFVPPVVFRAYR